MPFDLQTFLVGAAVTIDTALMISVLERRNLRNVAMPVVTLLLAVWLFHCGEFFRLLLVDATGPWAEPATWLAMSTTSAGILLMPSSLLHGALRLARSGAELRARPQWVYALTYIPLIVLPVAVRAIAMGSGQPYLDRVSFLVTPVTIWICAVNGIAIGLFLWQRRHIESRELRRFLAGIAALLAAESALLVFAFWIADPVWLNFGSPLLMLVVLSPLMPTLLFAYFVIRYRFMQLLLERTLVYGTLVATGLLFHRLFVQSMTDRLADRFHVNFGIIEGVCVFLLILLYQPIRRRVGESLRYLLGRDVTDLRARTRHLAVEMWEHVGDRPQQIIDWFMGALRSLFDAKLAAAWMFENAGRTVIHSGDFENFTDDRARALHGQLKSHSFVAVDGHGAPDLRAIDMLRDMRASFAVRLDHAGFSGLLVLGQHARGRDYSEEEINAVLLLVELLGATLHGQLLHAQRLQAEHVAAQNEKLSSLGMLTTCLAHEIKNPLSSVKTIATVMAEKFGPDHPQAEDVQLILSEVERLNTFTGQFLKFARPADWAGGSAAIQPVIDSAVQVLASFARGKDVRIDTRFEEDLPDVAADENALREIVFNLLLNAIEAVPRGGHICVEVRRNGRYLVTKVRDDGPGITPDMQNRIFLPFVSSKPTGTGLGLFIARRQVELLSGEIACECQPNEGTCFTVKLPLS